MNGRIQTFGNYNEGQGRPANGSDLDRNGRPRLQGRRAPGWGYRQRRRGELPDTTTAPRRPRTIRGSSARCVSGPASPATCSASGSQEAQRHTEVLGYTAVTVGIDSDERRKFSLVRPDWRESFLRVTGFWGSFTAGRTLGLFSRGATEITYLYGYRYGLGFPGRSRASARARPAASASACSPTVSAQGSSTRRRASAGSSSPWAATTPSAIRTRGSRPREMAPRRIRDHLPAHLRLSGFVKLFLNGASQRVYDRNDPISADIWGTGFGGRFEIGPVKIGFAGHYGKGIGVTIACNPTAPFISSSEIGPGWAGLG